jgi:ABC-type nitrate/sulfonate/bicarbonate transport system permease component
MQSTAARRAPTGVMLVLLLGACWEVSVRSGALKADAWPALSTVGAVFLDRTGAGGLWGEMADSLWNMAKGFALGSLLGLFAGVLLGASRRLFRMLEPTLELLRVIPLPALIPPALLALGGGSSMKVAIVALATFWPVFINTRYGVRSVEETLVEMAQTFGTPRARFAFFVMLPAALPLAAAGLRIALAAALITTVVTEMIAGNAGIGLYIMTMQNAARMPEVYAAIALLSLIGYSLNRGLLALEHRLLPWNELAQGTARWRGRNRAQRGATGHSGAP